MPERTHLGTREHQGARQHLSVTSCHLSTSSHRTPISLVFLANQHCPTVSSSASYIHTSCLHPLQYLQFPATPQLPGPAVQANTTRPHQVALSIATSLGPVSQETFCVAAANELGSSLLLSQWLPNPGIKVVLSKSNF